MSDQTPAAGPDIDPNRKTATDRRQHARYTVGFFTDDNKFGHVTDPLQRAAALTLHAASIGLTIAQGGDGHVRPEEVLDKTGLQEHPEIAKILLADGVWHQADHGCRRCPQPREGHVYVHDTLEHNRSAAQEEKIRNKRSEFGAKGANARWAGHTPKPKQPKRPVGRPRKNTPAPVVELTPQPDGQPMLVDVTPGAPVLQHPAETRARARRSRPARKEPRVFDQWVIDAAGALADGIAGNDPNGKRPNVTETWLNDIRLLHETDGREIDKIMVAIKWSQRHHFYSTIIKSPKNLRKHYAAMSTRAQQEKKKLAGAPRGAAAPPPAVSVPGINNLMAQQMREHQERQAGRQLAAAQGGLIKGGG